jgi:hypothetical protein
MLRQEGVVSSVRRTWCIGVGIATVLGGAWLLVVAEARADVVQLDGTPLPQPVSSAEILLSADLGWSAEQQIYVDFDGSSLSPPVTYSDLFPSFETGDAITLQGLFKWRSDPVDPVADASIGPGGFWPVCELSAELLLRGGNCNVAFGWYNVGSADSAPPTPDAIYELIPANTETFLQCATQNGEVQPAGTGFCPFAWDNHHPYYLPQPAWVPRPVDFSTLANDPRYLGGAIAFAVVGDPTSPCGQTKHTLARHNAISESGEPWVTTLVYPSRVDPRAYYFAFEDLPMSASDWTDPGDGALGRNDGDFNDFVFHVSGICPDGEDCVPGVCGTGGTGGEGGSATAGGAASAGRGSGGGGGADRGKCGARVERRSRGASGERWRRFRAAHGWRRGCLRRSVLRRTGCRAWRFWTEWWRRSVFRPGVVVRGGRRSRDATDVGCRDDWRPTVSRLQRVRRRRVRVPCHGE